MMINNYFLAMCMNFYSEIKNPREPLGVIDITLSCIQEIIRLTFSREINYPEFSASLISFGYTFES